MIQDARGWCTGMTQKDGMMKDVGGGFRLGNTCTPVVDSCQYMAKPIQYFKVKKNIRKKKEEYSYNRLYMAMRKKKPQLYTTTWINLRNMLIEQK